MGGSGRVQAGLRRAVTDPRPSSARCARPGSAASSGQKVGSAVGSSADDAVRSAGRRSPCSASSPSCLRAPGSSGRWPRGRRRAPDSSVTTAVSSSDGERLAAGHLGDHRRDLAGLVDGLGELVRVHAVLLRGGDQVLDQLLLADRTCSASATASSRIWLRRPCAASASTSARCSSSSRPALALEVTVAPRPRRAPSGTGISTVSSSFVESLLAGLHALLVRLDLLGLRAQVRRELVERVELAGQLGEVVVRRRAARAP